jgi:hypothetical protein
MSHCHQLRTWHRAPRTDRNAFTIDIRRPRGGTRIHAGGDDLRPRLKLPESWVTVPEWCLAVAGSRSAPSVRLSANRSQRPSTWAVWRSGKHKRRRASPGLSLPVSQIAPSVPVKHRLSLANQRHHRNLVVRPQSKVSRLKVSWRGRRLSRLLCTGRSWN